MSNIDGKQQLFPLPDARIGLGYGLLGKSGRYNSRQFNAVYPYTQNLTDFEDEAQDEEDIEFELGQAISARTLSDIIPTDSMASRGTDPFYFVGGNTRLSDSFWRVVHENEFILMNETNSDMPAGNSLVPYPRMYKHMTFGQQVSPVRSYGPALGFSSPVASPSGTKKGWSRSTLSLTQAIDQADHVEETGKGYDIMQAYDQEIGDNRHIKAIKNYTNKVNSANSNRKYKKQHI